MESRKHVDFISSIIIGIVAVYVIVDSIRMHIDSGEVIYYSPGIIPFIFGVGLLICTVMLLIRSLKGTNVKASLQKVIENGIAFTKTETAKTAFFGLLIMMAYIFILLPLTNFVISTFIFLVVFMLFMKAGNVVKSLIVSAITVALVYLLFVKAFGVPLP